MSEDILPNEPTMAQVVAALLETRTALNKVMDRNRALSVIVAFLMREIAVAGTDPDERLGAMVTLMQGMAHGVALDTSEAPEMAARGISSLEYTRQVEWVCSMAEGILRSFPQR